MLSEYTAHQINDIVNGKAYGESQEHIRQLITDSRKAIIAKDSIFFAIKGQHFDGHEFIIDSYHKGIRHFVVSDITDTFLALKDAFFIHVNDVVFALQKLSSYHRNSFQKPLIGITGSNGKTIVKEWLSQLLASQFSVVKNPKSYNSQVGVPLSVWRIKAEHDIGIFEAGISEYNEMENLEQILHPEIGIFTNIGSSHAANFNSEEEKILEKLKLFKHSKTLIFCKDHKKIEQQVKKIQKECGFKTLQWSAVDDTDMRVHHIIEEKNYSLANITYQNNNFDISIPFQDKSSLENCFHVILAALHVGMTKNQIQVAIKNLVPVAMRLELMTGINGSTIINDSYNSDPDSFKIALEFLDQQNKHHKKTVILSDILQSGESDKSLYQKINHLLLQHKINRFIGIGTAISKFKHLFSETYESHFYTNTNTFLKAFQRNDYKNESILLKGARVFHFEHISQLLALRIHETTLEINLNTLSDNLNYFRNKLLPTTKVMAMVKAFSYGSGGFEIAKVLEHHRVDYLTVAYPDEGIQLKEAGITVPIMVLNSSPHHFESIVNYGLEPEIYSLNHLKHLCKLLEKRQINNYPIHIKCDTGMHRLGFELHELNDLLDYLKAQNTIAIKSVFTHLLSSDNPKHNTTTQAQFSRYDKMCTEIEKVYKAPFLKHVLNSAGMEYYPEKQYDMVRLGIGLYGISSKEEDQKYLKDIGHLKAVVAQVKHIPKGDFVGYGQAFQAEKNMTIATVNIGYADGLDKRLGNGILSMIYQGQKLPIIGNICMDMCMVDISNVEVSEGDILSIFGPERSMSELAKLCNSTPYEILSGISTRVKRVYVQE